MSEPTQLEIEITYSKTFAEALRSGDFYAETPLSIVSEEGPLRTPTGDRFEVCEVVVTLLPRLLRASVEVVAGEQVALEFHATSVALAFDPGSEDVTIRAHLGSEVGPAPHTSPGALHAGCLVAATELLEFVESVEPALQQTEPVARLEDTLDSVRSSAE